MVLSAAGDTSEKLPLAASRTHLPSSEALLQLGLQEDTMSAVVGLPSDFSPITGPVVRTTKARHNPLA